MPVTLQRRRGCIGLVLLALGLSAGAQSSGVGPATSPGRLEPVSSLLLVPFCDFLPNADCGAWKAIGRVSDFSLSEQGQAMVLRAKGPLFEGLFGQERISLDKVAGVPQWVYRATDRQTSAELLLQVSVSGQTEAGHVLKLCDAAGQCFPFLLPNRAGVCRFVSDGPNVNAPMLSAINALQDPKNRISCP